MARLIAANRTLLSLLLLALLVAAAHGAAIGFGFVMDDWPQIAQNARLGRLGLDDAFRRGTMANSALAVQAGDSYRPFFVLWLAGGSHLFGAQPLGWHMASVLLHLLNVVLLWRLAGRLMPEFGALAAAGLFAIHPALAQSVAWISGITDPLMTLAVLGALFCHLRWRREGGMAWPLLTALLYLVALLTKETALPLVLVLVAFDRFLGVDWRRTAGLAPLVLVIAGWAVLRSQVLGQAGGEAGLVLSAEGLRRLLDYGLYAFEALVFPWPQPYLFKPPVHHLATLALVPAAAVIGILCHAAGWRASLFAGAFCLLFLAAPLSVALHSIGAFAFRFLYLPMVGFALLAGLAAIRLRATRPDLMRPLLAVVIVVGIGGSVAAAQDWRNDETFYTLVIRSAPDAGSGYAGLARHWERQGDTVRQQATLVEAAASVKDPVERLSVLESLGILMAQNGRLTESLQVFKQLAALPAGRHAGLVGIANITWMMGDLPGALAAYDEALRGAPHDRATRANRERLVALWHRSGGQKSP